MFMLMFLCVSACFTYSQKKKEKKTIVGELTPEKLALF